MIKDAVNGDVFKTSLKHIAFAINTDGYNDSGFAGQVSQFTEKFINTGERKLGEVITVETDNKIFHGLVCHSLNRNGWKETPKFVTECLDKVDVPKDESIAVVLMGAGFIGSLCGAAIKENVEAIHRSKKSCVVYTLQFTKKAVFDVIT